MGGDVHVLAQGTVFSDDSSGLNMAEMPNLSPGADGHPIVDIAAFMHEKIPHRPENVKIPPSSF
jgi:hypothetical protein